MENRSPLERIRGAGRRINQGARQVAALPELALELARGRVPGQAKTPKQFLHSALDIATRPPGALGGMDPGSLYGKATSPEGKAALYGQGDLANLPVSPLFMGGVQAVPGASSFGEGVSKMVIDKVRQAEALKDPMAVQAIFDDVARIKSMGGSLDDFAARPWHQPVLERAANEGNVDLMGKTMKAIQKSDPEFFKNLVSLPTFKKAFELAK